MFNAKNISYVKSVLLCVNPMANVMFYMFRKHVECICFCIFWKP
jgi:hypothetical protein